MKKWLIIGLATLLIGSGIFWFSKDRASIGDGIVILAETPKVETDDLLEIRNSLEIKPSSEDFPMTIPSESLGDQMLKALTISINAKGNYTVNNEKKKLSLNELEKRLNTYSNHCKKINASPSIQISVAPECAQEKVIDILNAIRGENINTVTFTDSGADEN